MQRAPLLRVISVHGRSFVFGLRWTTPLSATTLVEEAEQAAQAEQADYVVLRRRANQFGLGILAEPPAPRRRMFQRLHSGVAAIADATGVSTLAAFPLEDESWLVVVIARGGILPDGDQIVRSEGEARAWIDRVIKDAPTVWRRKYLPASWGIPDSKPGDPQELLLAARSPALIPLPRLVHRKRIRWSSVTAAVTVALTVAGYLYLHQPAPIVAPPPPPPPEAQWAPAKLALGQCVGAIGEAQRYSAVPGWSLTKYACEPGAALGVTLTQNATGLVAVLLALVPRALIADDGHSGNFALPLTPLPTVRGKGYAKRDQYVLAGLDMAQHLSGQFLVQGVRDLVPPGQAAAAATVIPWRAYGWTYTTTTPPSLWEGPVAAMGAISVESVVYTPADGAWTLGGNIYAAR